MNPKKIAFATSCDLNYIAQAHALAKSVKKYYPDSSFYLGLNENNSELEPLILERVDEFDFVLTGTRLHPNFDELESRYGIVELCCSVKPSLLLKCFNDENEYVIYLDPDTFLFKELFLAFEYLHREEFEAIFTPHLTNLGNLEMEVSAMKHGVLNLGFLGLKKTQNTLEFLNWWDLRLRKFCIRDPHRGIFTDQTWAVLGVGFLKSKILNDPGYNFATWNLSDHEVTTRNDVIFIDDSELAFAHFSSYSIGGIEKFIQKYQLNVSETFLNLLDLYSHSVSRSSEVLEQVIKLKVDKVHYKKRHIYQKSKIEIKILVVDFLNVNFPLLLRILVCVKNKKINR
jgi:hypothetical protein